VIFDTDDLYEGHDRLDLLRLLKDANSLFRMTAFAIPGLCSDGYIESLPAWIEVVPHGDNHGDPPADGGEWRDWTYEQTWEFIYRMQARSPRWLRGAKAPGWVISDEALEAFADADWWVADQRYNDHRRPFGLRVHCEGEGDHLHTHVQNVCGNGLQETFPMILARVTGAKSFELVSEVVRPWIGSVVTA
jgi:hypothetical protein